MRKLLGLLSVVVLAACNSPETNQSPVIDGAVVTTPKNTAVTIQLTASDPEGTELTWSISTPSHGAISGSVPSIVYTPTAGFVGADSFEVTVSDGSASASATVRITVSDVNAAPIAVDDVATTDEDTSLVVSAATLLANDTDAQALTVTSVADATHGTVSLANGNVTFVPEADFNGVAGFSYSVSDGSLTASATVRITVNAVNDAPVIVDDTASTDEDTAFVLATSVLLANDSDVDSTLTITSVGDATHGTVVLNGSSITFTPAPAFYGLAGFSYVVSDGSLNATGQVVVTVNAVADAVVAVNDTATTNEDVDLVLSTATLLANDLNEDGLVLTVASVGAAVNGAATLLGNSITFSPTANFNGNASFSYTLSDGTATSTAIVSVTVTAVNDAPVAVADAVAAQVNTPLTIIATSLLANDTDLDLDVLSVANVGSAVNGSVAIVGGAIVFTPATNFRGAASFTYTVTDGALTASALVAVTVEGGVVAQNAVVSTRKNVPVALTLIATDAAGAPLTFAIVTPPASGTLTGTGSTLTYTPNNDFLGVDSVVFQATAGTTSSNTATISITVNEPVCGNGMTEAGEVCDDNNTVAGDGCRADCRGVEVCGDGRVDSAKGEQCDDGNTVSNDGCSSTCQLAAFATTTPVVISGSLSCSTLASNSNRLSAIDAAGNLYIAMTCGGTAYVATSTDRGVTWNAPVSAGMNSVAGLAIEGGASGVAYLVVTANPGTTLFSRTIDSGVTWSAPVTLSSTTSPNVSIDAFEQSVFVSIRVGSGLRLLRNFTSGDGAFSTVDITQANSFHDVVVDKISGSLFSVSDNPAFRVRVSIDQGNTFAAEASPPGQAFFSDWAGSNGRLYVTGTNGDDNIDVISMASPGASSQVHGLSTNVGPGSLRAIDADALGNAYVVTQLSNGVIQLDRMVVNATSISASDVRSIAASGSYPSVAALPSNNGALLAYAASSVVYAAIVVYP